MRVLWITNQCIPVVAKHLNLEIGNKEGWLAGISERFLAEKAQDITLGICFPMPAEKADLKAEFEVTAYGYEDDRVRPEEYRENLEKRFGEIFEDFKPDVIHIFGTEYGHTLAAAKACKDPSKLLIGIQGLCGVYANHFTEGLPEKVIEAATLRDKLKNDNIKRQQENFPPPSDTVFLKPNQKIQRINVYSIIQNHMYFIADNICRIKCIIFFSMASA